MKSDSTPAPFIRLLHLVRGTVAGGAIGLRPTLWILFGARILNALAFTAAFPFLATYLANDRGMATTAVGAVYMAQGFVGAGFQLVGGVLSDRYGRRRMMLLSLLVRAGIALGIGLAVHAVAPLWLVCGLFLLNAVFAGLFQPAADALVVDLTSGEERISAFAFQRVAINVGWTIGPVLGGFVAAQTAFELLFFVASPLIVLGTLVLSRISEPARHVSATRENPLRSLGVALADRPLRLQLAGALLTYMLAGQLVVTLSIDGAERFGLGREDIGLLWTVNGLMVVLLQMSVARLVSRMGTRTALVTGSLVYGASYASVGFATGFGSLVACMVAITIGELLNAPAQQTAVAARARPETIGRSLGLLGLTMMLGRSLGPFVGGAAHDALGRQPVAMWGAIGLLGLAAALVYLHPALNERQKPAPQPDVTPVRD